MELGLSSSASLGPSRGLVVSPLFGSGLSLPTGRVSFSTTSVGTSVIGSSLSGSIVADLLGPGRPTQIFNFFLLSFSGWLGPL